jgi:hypothetical protein
VSPTFLSYSVKLNFSLSPTAAVKQLGVPSVVEIPDEKDSVYVAWEAAGLPTWPYSGGWQSMLFVNRVPIAKITCRGKLEN